MIIEQQDIEIFQKHLTLFETIKKANFVRNYTKETFFELIKLFEKYISPKHTFVFHCGECRFFLVKQLFTFYENQLTEQAKQVVQVQPEETTPEETIEQVAFQKPEKRKYKKRNSKL